MLRNPFDALDSLRSAPGLVTLAGRLFFGCTAIAVRVGGARWRQTPPLFLLFAS